MWGFGDISCIENVHIDFLKYVLHVKKSTPHVMIYGEFGRYLLSIIIQKRIVAFWCKLVNGSINRLSSSLYRILLDDFRTHNFRCDWISYVKAIFDDTGLSYIWFEHHAENKIVAGCPKCPEYS